MIRVKYFLIVMLSFTFMNVYALDNCTSDEMVRLRELANNIDIKYEPKIEEIKNEGVVLDILVSYNLTVTNYNEDLKLYLKIGNGEKQLTTVEELQTKTFYEENNIQIQVYSWTNNLCTNELLRTISLKLPSYSRFYYFHKDECNKYPDFKYCKETLDISSLNFDDDEDKVLETFKNYLKTKGVISINDDIKVPNYYLFGGTFLVLVILVSFILIKQKKKKKKDDL